MWEPPAQETNFQPAWKQRQEWVISTAGSVAPGHKRCRKEGRDSPADWADEGPAELLQDADKNAVRPM